MMANKRFIGGFLIVLAILGVAGADYSDYDVSLKVLPGQAFENNDVLVGGYLTINDWGEIVGTDKFQLKILENTDEGLSTKRILSLGDAALNYENDLNDEGLLVDGFFYTTLSDLDAGNYIAKVLIDGYEVKIERFTVLEGDSNFTVFFDGFTEDEGPYVSVMNENDSPADAVLYYYGRTNFDSPETIDMTGVPVDTLTEAPMVTGFQLSDYVGEEEVYAIIVYGVAGSDVTSSPSLIIRNNGYRSGVYDGSVSVIEESVKKGAGSVLAYTVENEGELPATYRFELSGSLSEYVEVPSNKLLEPEEEYEGELEVNVPEDYAGETGTLTLKLFVGDEEVDDRAMTLNLLEADPIHSIIVRDVVFDKTSYFKGETVVGTIILLNDGDYSETVDIKYYFEDEPVNRETSVVIEPGTERNFTIVTEAVDSPSLIVQVDNEHIDFDSSFVANVVPKNYDFSFYLEDDELISQDSLTENVMMTIENTGNVEDSYHVMADYEYYELTENGVILGPEEEMVINATVNVPLNEESLLVNFTVCSQRGDECQNDSLDISIFRIEEPEEESESEVGINETSLKGSLDEGAIYEFEVTNNKRIAKEYNVSYQSSGNVSFSVYPNDSFVVQPGETVKVFMYATPLTEGVYEINYTFTESGTELTNGTLTLTTETGFDNLTGFAVAAGSVLGVAGLIVLVLFIYFYFIRQPPEGGEDEFRPVEVKKADLTKPNVKNETKYW